MLLIKFRLSVHGRGAAGLLLHILPVLYLGEREHILVRQLSEKRRLHTRKRRNKISKNN